MLRWECSGGPSIHPDLTFRINIGIATTQNEGSIIPWMIVKMPSIVRPIPVVKAY